MCFAFFAGYGYSGGFSRHMGELLSALTPGVLVKLVIGTDAVCSACPHNQNGVCETTEKTAAYDNAVLEHCGLVENSTLAFGAFTALVQKRILASGLRYGICGDCQWNSLCDSQPSRWAENKRREA